MHNLNPPQGYLLSMLVIATTAIGTLLWLAYNNDTTPDDASQVNTDVGPDVVTATKTTALPVPAPSAEASAWQQIDGAKLRGVVASDQPSLASAIIEMHGQQDSFVVGDTLFDTDIRLSAVYPQKVAVSYRDEHRFLMLATDGISMAPPSGEALMADLENVSVKGVFLLSAITHEEQIVGYRLSPSGDSFLFQQLGFESGDILTAVNGLALTDEDAHPLALMALQQEPQLMLSLLRHGSPLTVFVDRSDREQRD